VGCNQEWVNLKSPQIKGASAGINDEVNASSFYGDVPSYDGNVPFERMCDASFGRAYVQNLKRESVLLALNDGAFFLGDAR